MLRNRFSGCIALLGISSCGDTLCWNSRLSKLHGSISTFATPWNVFWMRKRYSMSPVSMSMLENKRWDILSFELLHSKKRKNQFFVTLIHSFMAYVSCALSGLNARATGNSILHMHIGKAVAFLPFGAKLFVDDTLLFHNSNELDGKVKIEFRKHKKFIVIESMEYNYKGTTVMSITQEECTKALDLLFGGPSNKKQRTT